jgi:protein-tyrosine phosphatase
VIEAGRTAAIVLAAGASSRFRSPKALAPLRGRPLLQHVLDVAAAPGFAEIVVVLGHDADEIERCIRWRAERRVRNPDPDAGLSSSLRVGLDSLSPASQAALILLGDQPLVRAEVVEALLAGFVSEALPIVVPRYRDGGGPNPLLIHRLAWPLADEARADRGLGPVVRDHPDLVFEVNVEGSNPDVDTPEDLAALETAPYERGRESPAAPPTCRQPKGEPETHTDRSLQLASLPNLRDVGGLTTADGGRIRTGLLFRSAALDGLGESDAAEFARLGIRTIYDFRTEEERTARPDRVPPDARYVAVDVLDDLAGHKPGEIQEAMSNPAVANEAFRDGKGTAMFVAQYRAFVSLDSARRAFGRVFRDLTDERRRPALIHCMGGKDRTGWAAASLQLFLGVSEDLVVQDFMASNVHLGPMFQSFFDDFAARGGDADLIAEFLWVRPEYLEAALDEMRRSFGTIERYFEDGLGLDEGTLRALRATFLDGVSAPQG